MPVSKLQLRWANTPSGEKALGASRVSQWDAEAKGKDLPERGNGTDPFKKRLKVNLGGK